MNRIKHKLKNGSHIIIRKPRMSDLDEMTKYINVLVDERVRISLTQNVTRKREKKYLRDLLRRVRRNSMLSLIALCDKKIVGKAEIWRSKTPSKSHVAEIGVSVDKNYRRRGIATSLMKTLIANAKKKWKTRIIKVVAVEDNLPAIALYKKLGFKITGRIPKGHYYGKKYYDDLIFVKEL